MIQRDATVHSCLASGHQDIDPSRQQMRIFWPIGFYCHKIDLYFNKRFEYHLLDVIKIHI